MQSQVVFLMLMRLFTRDMPKIFIVDKKASWLHRFIGWVLRFPWYPKSWQINPYYMTSYWTTLGFEIAYPHTDNMAVVYDEWPILCHERVHVGQAKRITRFLFGSLYLLGTPVYFAVFSLLGLLLLPLWLHIDMWWIVLIFIGTGALFSIPYPFAYFRARFELEAYTVSMAIVYWKTGRIADGYIKSLTSHFTGSSYFYMWPVKKTVRKWLVRAKKDIKNGTIFTKKYRNHGYHKFLYTTLQKWGIIKKMYKDLDI